MCGPHTAYVQNTQGVIHKPCGVGTWQGEEVFTKCPFYLQHEPLNLIKSKMVHKAKGGMGSKMFKKLSMWFIDYPQGKIGNDWYLILLYLFKGWQNYLRLARYVDLDGQVRSNFDVFCTASWNFFDVWSLVALWTGTVTRPFLLINTQSLSVFNCLKLAQF